MGTNYYLKEAPRKCSHCGHDPSRTLHIGKSSVGWCFSLHVIAEEGLNDLDDWKKKILDPENTIIDEYDREVSPKEMLLTIELRSCRSFDEIPPIGYVSWEEFHWKNNSMPGPNNLFRHKIDGTHCVKHGAGTWDCIAGEFS